MHRVALLVVLASLVLTACTRAAEEPGTRETSTGSVPQATSSTLVETVDIAVERTLNRQYEACLLDAGFDPEGVQVLFDDSGELWWVKTGHNVPADLHGLCFGQIGGEPNGLRSWG